MPEVGLESAPGIDNTQVVDFAFRLVRVSRLIRELLVRIWYADKIGTLPKPAVNPR